MGHLGGLGGRGSGIHPVPAGVSAGSWRRGSLNRVGEGSRVRSSGQRPVEALRVYFNSGAPLVSDRVLTRGPAHTGHARAPELHPPPRPRGPPPSLTLSLQMGKPGAGGGGGSSGWDRPLLGPGGSPPTRDRPGGCGHGSPGPRMRGCGEEHSQPEGAARRAPGGGNISSAAHVELGVELGRGFRGANEGRARGQPRGQCSPRPRDAGGSVASCRGPAPRSPGGGPRE